MTAKQNALINALKRFGVTQAVAAVLTIFAASTFAFIEISGEVREGETLKFDNAILAALRSPSNPSDPVGPAWLLSTFQDISALGGVAVLTLLTIAICSFCLLHKKIKLTLFFLGSMGGGALLMVALKLIFARPRPSVVPHLVPVSMESFPSGHSMSAAIFYLTLGALLAQSTTRPLLKWFYYGFACLIALLVGFSRVYLGVHYPTDVLAGWCAGIAWSCATYLISEWLQRKGTLESGDEDDEQDAAAGKDEAATTDRGKKKRG